MVSPRICVVSGERAAVTACLLSQILSGRGRTGLAALGDGFAGEVEELLSRLERFACSYAVIALPEGRRWQGCQSIETAVFLTRGTGEAAQELALRCQKAVVNLDDPDGAVIPPDGVAIWHISERNNAADITAKNLRLLPFRTEFEAVTRDGISRLSVPLPDGQGLYPGLCAAAAALSFGVPVAESALRLRRAEPVPAGMVSLAGVGPFADTGYFEPETERIREI